MMNDKRKGILAYLGDSKALAQIQVDKSTIKGSGATGFALWRSVYLSKQVSLRNRVLVVIDWATSRAFGRGELLIPRSSYLFFFFSHCGCSLQRAN